MALKLIANYAKRLGLPGFSSHQYSLCLEAEVTNINDVAGESSRLYETLQNSVDDQIQQTGFVPDDAYGIDEQGSRNGQNNGHNRNGNNGNGNHNGNGTDTWQCSDKQRDLILKLTEEHGLDKTIIENLARERFNGKGVRQLNKLEASGLIAELFERTGQKQPARGRNRGNGAPVHQNGGAR